MAEASQINPCLENILSQRNITIENQKQIECLVNNEEFNKAPLDLCEEISPSSNYVSYLEYKAKFQDAVENLKKDPQNKCKFP